MQIDLLTFLPLIAPFALLLYAGLLLMNRTAPLRASIVQGEGVGLLGIITSIVSAWMIFEYGTMQSILLGWKGLGFAVRLDTLSITMFTMIALLGFVILKFSANYLDGDPRQRVFFARLATTIGSVELLILSGNLFQILVLWVITSVCLHYLLVFYRNRPQAIAAARKKFIVARLGDISLLGAIVLIYASIGSGDLDAIFTALQSRESLDSLLVWATVLLVITAALKSAQFPTYGWLIEVVETPTPVSALLHAGLLNAGPFLMVRLSFLMSESTPASMLLIGISGFTALFASVVFLTQPSIKVSLGYSSIAHMGFSLLLCGFGLYAASLLHVVAHSFYKAHSFLSSGSVIDGVKSRRVALPKRSGHLGRIGLSVIASLAVFLLACYLWGIQPTREFNLMIIGSIIVMGLSQLLVQTLDVKGSFKAVMQSVLLAAMVSLSFLSLEQGARMLIQLQIPVMQVPSVYIKGAAIILLTGYALVIFIQLISPRLKDSALGYRLGVHLRNGLYANLLFDRVIGSLKYEKFKWANLTVQEEADPKLAPAASDESLYQEAQMLITNN